MCYAVILRFGWQNQSPEIAIMLDPGTLIYILYLYDLSIHPSIHLYPSIHLSKILSKVIHPQSIYLFANRNLPMVNLFKTFQQLTRTTRFNIVYRCWDTPNIWIHIWRCPIHGGNPKSSKSFAYTFSIETTMVTWGSLVLGTSPDTYLYTPQKRCPKHSEHGPQPPRTLW